MRARLIVIRHVATQDSQPVALVECDDVIEAVPAQWSNAPVGICVLPRGTGGDNDVLKAEGRNPSSETLAIDPVPIANDVPGSRRPRQRFDHLLGGPSRRRVSGDVAVPHSPADAAENHEHTQQLAFERRHNCAIDGDHRRKVVAQARPPSLGRRVPRPARHVLRQRRLRQVKPKLGQLPLNPWRAPRRVGRVHRRDEFDDGARNSRPTRRAPLALPAPVPAEAATMPSDDRLRFQQEQRFPPAGPESRQHHPIDASGWAQLDSAPPMLSLKHQDVVAECEKLGFQVGPTANDVPDSTE